jgi:hypothetical protein
MLISFLFGKPTIRTLMHRLNAKNAMMTAGLLPKLPRAIIAMILFGKGNMVNMPKLSMVSGKTMCAASATKTHFVSLVIKLSRLKTIMYFGKTGAMVWRLAWIAANAAHATSVMIFACVAIVKPSPSIIRLFGGLPVISIV